MRGGVGLLLVAAVCLAGGGRIARAEIAPPRAAPVRVAIECESEGRTKACPAFLLGFVEAHRVLLASPRASADVVLYASATEVATVDKLHLRFVGAIAGAPPVVEIDVDLDSRADDDAQRAQLEPAFLRGIALFVGARHPSAVTVALAEPSAAAIATPDTTPWGVALSINGLASYTQQYQSAQIVAELSVSRLERSHRFEATLSGITGLNRQPPLVLPDGTEVALNTEQWAFSGGLEGVRVLSPSWSIGLVTRGGRDDPKGQHQYWWNARGGVEWDRYPADDPRGNRLALIYFAGYTVEGYNLRNDRGEKFAHYPSHGVIASGSVRKDRISIGLSLALQAMVLHPARRYNVSASPFIEWKLGGHIDLSLSFSATKRQLPGPDPAEIDPGDYEQQSRLQYAEPFSFNGTLNVSIHWDRTNGARNDRFDDL